MTQSSLVLLLSICWEVGYSWIYWENCFDIKSWSLLSGGRGGGGGSWNIVAELIQLQVTWLQPVCRVDLSWPLVLAFPLPAPQNCSWLVNTWGCVRKSNADVWESVQGSAYTKGPPRVDTAAKGDSLRPLVSGSPSLSAQGGGSRGVVGRGEVLRLLLEPCQHLLHQGQWGWSSDRYRGRSPRGDTFGIDLVTEGSNLGVNMLN